MIRIARNRRKPQIRKEEPPHRWSMVKYGEVCKMDSHVLSMSSSYLEVEPPKGNRVHGPPESRPHRPAFLVSLLSSSQCDTPRSSGETYSKCSTARIKMKWLKLKEAFWTTKWKSKWMLMKKLTRWGSIDTCICMAISLFLSIWNYHSIFNHLYFNKGFLGGSVVKNPRANARDIRDAALIPGSGRFLGGGHGNPLQYSSPENPMDRGVWLATVHRISQSQTGLKWLSRDAHTPIQNKS